MHHVIVGAGPAGVIAAETLRKQDADAKITLVGDEPEPPYSRMAIPYLLIDKVGEQGTHLRKGADHYQSLGIDVVQDRAKQVDSANNRLVLEKGGQLDYDRLLLATGSRPILPPVPGSDLPGVHTCWTLEDARHILERAQSGAKVLLIGAGFIGCIVLEALALRGVKLTVVEMGDRMVPRMMNETAGNMIKSWCENKDIRVLTSTKVESIEGPGGSAAQGNGNGGGLMGFIKGLFGGGDSDGKEQPAATSGGHPLKVTLSNGETLEADLVISAAGVKPNLEFLEGSGIETDQGIKVNDRMQTSVSNVYAAGDVAQGRDFSTGELDVHAIQPTAAEHGRVAAQNMAGIDTPFRGSFNMNVLDTLGLISVSFGLWMGVEGGDNIELSDPENFRYINLQFRDDVLVGATALGFTQHVGVLRGLIQGERPLGEWKERLRRDPLRVMEAYLATNQAVAAA